MIGREGWYSVIQYCPDRFRAEGVNVGVVLLCPDPHFLRARVVGSNQRIARFFGRASFDPTRVNLAKQGIEHRINASGDELRTAKDLGDFARTRANDLRLTEPRLTKVTDPEADLSRLFDSLVDARGADELLDSTRYEVLPPELNEVFHRLAAAGRVHIPERVIVPVLGRRIVVPYAYQNGILNLVKPEIFPKGKKADNTAMRLAIEGDLLHRHPEGTMQRRLIVVSAEESPSMAAETEERVAPLFDEYGVRLVRRSQTADFAREVEAQAH